MRPQKWLLEIRKTPARLAVIELGAGSALQTVRRFSELVAIKPGCTLIRINPGKHDVPEKAIGPPLGVAKAMPTLAQNLPFKKCESS